MPVRIKMLLLCPDISASKSCVQNRTRSGFLNNLQEIYTSVNSSAYKLQNYTGNTFFMSHWEKWGMVFIPGNLYYRSATFLFPFSSLRMRRTQASKCSHFNTSRVVQRRGWGSGYPQFQLHESPVILHLLHCHNCVKLDPFLQEKRIHDFISNLSLLFTF